MSADVRGRSSRTRFKATIVELGLTVRTYNALRRAGYNLVEELVRCSDKGLLKLRNIGKTNLNEIRNALRTAPQEVPLPFSSWSLYQQQRQSEAYDLLMRIESKIRQFIRYNLQHSYGKSWWTSGIPSPIQRYVSNRTRSVQYSSSDPMEFIDFGDYKSIIASDTNWNNVFSKILGLKDEIVEHLDRINQLRRFIAHTRPIDSGAYDQLSKEARFIQKAFRIKREALPTL